jgi:hypothetical protein
VYTVKEKGRKPDGKPYPLPYGLRNLKSENSQDYAQKPQRNFTFMNSASASVDIFSGGLKCIIIHYATLLRFQYQNEMNSKRPKKY